jgi:hypothetical protein
MEQGRVEKVLCSPNVLHYGLIEIILTLCTFGSANVCSSYLCCEQYNSDRLHQVVRKRI